MLLDLTIANYRSVYEPASINMVATREQVHRERCPELARRYKKRVNPVAALFGANAAGKSTFVMALTALQRMLIDPPRPSDPMPFDPFALRPDAAFEPTTFEVLFSVDDIVYEYVLAFDAKSVVEERLTKYLSKDEIDVFERVGDSFSFPLLEEKSERFPTEVAQARVLLESVPPKVPLASFASETNLSRFPDSLKLDAFGVVRAFVETILVIPAGLMDIGHLQSQPDGWEDLISQIDAGITGVETELVELSALGLGAEQALEIEQELRSNPDYPMDVELSSGRFTLRLDGDEIEAQRITLLHSAEEGGNYGLRWWDESDGTRSATRLLGLFSRLATPGFEAVLVVDEFDRSFHTELSRALIGGFLANSSADSRAQLIFTTHDLLLMDPETLRRDEIWVIEKDRSGQTQTSVLSDFEGPRKTTDLRKSYLRGRFGGVPSIKPLEFSNVE